MTITGLLQVGLIIVLGGVAIIVHQLHQLIKEIKSLHQDIGVIRLDNTRTLSEIRRRYR